MLFLDFKKFPKIDFFKDFSMFEPSVRYVSEEENCLIFLVGCCRAKFFFLTRNVEQKSLVVVLHELYNNSGFLAKVFQTDDPHDV